MTQEEKEKLLSLFHAPHRWCREVDARDEQGNSVSYDDARAAAWDIVGALCHLFGWPRARELFPVVGRHVVGPHVGHTFHNTEFVAMDALQEFNDHADTTFDLMLARLRQVPDRLPA